MREFPNIGEFLKFAERLPVDAKAAVEIGVEVGTRMIWKEARSELGHYQRDQFHGAPWAELADATKEEREYLGYPPNDPLYRQGLLHDYTRMSTEENMGRVGVPSVMVQHEYREREVDIGDVAMWQELGTPDARNPIQARSFLGHSAAKMKDLVVNAISGRFVWALRGNGAKRDDL